MNIQIIAKNYAIAAHREIDQRRKGTEALYEVHPIRVASIIKIFTPLQDHDLVASAAYLHDVLEDTLRTENELRSNFGDEITDLVKSVTKFSTPAMGNRKVRSALDFQHVSNCNSNSQNIKLADIYDNVRNIAYVLPKFAEVYINEKFKLIKMLHRGDPILKELVMETLFTAKEDLFFLRGKENS